MGTQTNKDRLGASWAYHHFCVVGIPMTVIAISEDQNYFSTFIIIPNFYHYNKPLQYKVSNWITLIWVRIILLKLRWIVTLYSNGYVGQVPRQQRECGV